MLYLSRSGSSVGPTGVTQTFQYGEMAFPFDPAAAIEETDSGDLTFSVEQGTPTTNSGWLADARDGRGQESTTLVQDFNGGGGVQFGSCSENSSCLEPDGSDPEDPDLSEPDEGEFYTDAGCLTGGKGWYGFRKNVCLVQKILIVANDLETGLPLGKLPGTLKTGILTSHKSGEYRQNYFFQFGQLNPIYRDIGQPVLNMTFNVFGATGSVATTSGSNPVGSAVTPGGSLDLTVTWKNLTGTTGFTGAIQNRRASATISFGNNSPRHTPSTPAVISNPATRCDTTMFTSAKNPSPGCVFNTLTPNFDMNSSKYATQTPQASGHVQAALAAGIPGGSLSNPLHRLADTSKRDVNRQTACPKSGPIRDGRRLATRSCDEYPFASTNEGAALSGGPGRTFQPQCHVPDLAQTPANARYSICMIDATQNSTAGSRLGAFYGSNRVIDADAFTVSAVGSLPPTP